MGFYSPAQLVRDAREHGVEVRPVDVNASDWDCTLEPAGTGYHALRLGFRQIKGFRQADAAARERARPALLALGVTVFPLNTHLAFYSTFWGGLTLLLAALYAGSLLAREA